MRISAILKVILSRKHILNIMRYDKEQLTTIFVVITTAFITTFTGSALTLAVPAIGRYFGVSAGFVGWLVTAYTLVVAAFSVPWGRIADLTGRKRILVIGLIVFTATSAICYFASSMWMLIIFRGIQGIGAAMIFSTNTAILISAFSSKERGRILGMSVAATYVGLSAGPAIGGFMNHNFGWRSIFILVGVIAMIALAAAWRALPSDRKNEGKQDFDIAGIILFIAMIVMMMYGLSAITGGLIPVIITAAGLLLAVMFVRHELKVKSPVVQVRMFSHNIAYSFSNLAALMNYGATFAITYLLSIYLQVVMGYSSQAAGLILIVQPALMAILSPRAGKLSDRISPFKLASAGMGLCAAGVLICAFLETGSTLAMVIVALAVTGIGFAMFSSPNTNAVMACVEKQDYGVASSILATMRSVGHTLSMVIVTIVVNLYMGSQALEKADPQLLVKTMHTAFLIYAGICVAGIFVSLKRKESGKECLG